MKVSFKVKVASCFCFEIAGVDPPPPSHTLRLVFHFASNLKFLADTSMRGVCERSVSCQHEPPAVCEPCLLRCNIAARPQRLHSLTHLYPTREDLFDLLCLSTAHDDTFIAVSYSSTLTSFSFFVCPPPVLFPYRWETKMLPHIWCANHCSVHDFSDFATWFFLSTCSICHFRSTNSSSGA